MQLSLDFHWWLLYDQCCHLHAPHNLKCGSWPRKFVWSQLFWYRLCQLCIRLNHLAQSFRVAGEFADCCDCLSVIGIQPMQPTLKLRDVRKEKQKRARERDREKKREKSVDRSILNWLYGGYLYKKIEIPVGFKPPVLLGMAPASPRAAKPAKGFFAKPAIYMYFLFFYFWLVSWFGWLVVVWWKYFFRMKCLEENWEKHWINKQNLIMD